MRGVPADAVFSIIDDSMYRGRYRVVWSSAKMELTGGISDSFVSKARAKSACLDFYGKEPLDKGFSCPFWNGDTLSCGKPGGCTYETEKPKRKMTIASFCAMTCAEGGFHKFLSERFDIDCPDKDVAKEIVCNFCEIASRSELNVEGPARENWLGLQAQYQDWLRT